MDPMVRMEFHADSGYVEKIIVAARARIASGMNESDVFADLVSHGVDEGQAHHAIAAAKILLGDERP